MESKDGSMGLDFEGTFVAINPRNEIQLALTDDRKVTIKFSKSAGGVDVIETFDAENEFPGEQQRQGWLAILNNFKAHAETSGT